MPKRALFVCARGTGRAHLAASLLQGTMDPDHWEACWSAPPVDQQDMAIVEQILRE